MSKGMGVSPGEAPGGRGGPEDERPSTIDRRHRMEAPGGEPAAVRQRAVPAAEDGSHVSSTRERHREWPATGRQPRAPSHVTRP
ncbi:hypothetical protein SCOCK_360049 [Actinacidiphila cocklensis]|uniref:Uncharacterized protein n=1 Tax=Actinacidiphila cocklensis TaxID=887465 RepID=A0A9W4DT76_9ACTN|nr:hypothetical protein SCOCK_360049 [Actinacidiphila cocklensis]